MNWGERVRKALKDPKVITGIAQVATAWMEEHIQRNEGRGAGGATVAHKPLKKLTGRFWTGSRPRNATVIASRKVTKIVNGKAVTRTMYQVEQVGYRHGGQPLRDTGKLAGSLSASGTAQGNSIRIAMSGRRYGLYQDRGFRTKGPNYIPLTRKGARQHGTGNNPNNEGLTRGKDYMMRWRGVTVPARPFILPTRADMIVLGRSIYLGLKNLLKGT